MADTARKLLTDPVHPSERSSEFSYGIIPLRVPSYVSDETSLRNVTPSTVKILVIHQKTAVSTMPYFWAFPKGHPEPGDSSPKATALRELFEETGLKLKDGEAGILFQNSECDGKEGLVERYRNPIKGCVMEVRYWIGIVDFKGEGEQSMTLQGKEIADAKWCTWEEAMELCTFERPRAILKRVMELLDREKTLL